jgi:hypothetical protein
MAELSRHRQVRLRNLQKANDARRVRAELREKLRTGEVEPITLMRGENTLWEPVINSWRLEQLVPYLPGIGSSTVQEIYEVGRFAPTMKFRALSPTRRQELAKLCAQGQMIPHNASARRR